MSIVLLDSNKVRGLSPMTVLLVTGRLRGRDERDYGGRSNIVEENRIGSVFPGNFKFARIK